MNINKRIGSVFMVVASVLLLSGVFAIGPLSSVTNAATTTGTAVTGSVTCDKAKKTQFLTFPFWYRGLNVSASDCNIASPEQVGGLSVFIWRIASNVIEIGLQAVAYIVAVYMLVAGFKLLLTEGNSDRLVNARNTITMAAVGFAISVAGIAIINVISVIFIKNP